MNILGMVQTPYELNTLAKVVKTTQGFELGLFLNCGSNTNSVITEPELEYMTRFYDVCEWEVGPMQYTPPASKVECDEKYDDIRVTSVDACWDSIFESDLISIHPENFDTICNICENKITDTVIEVEPVVESYKGYSGTDTRLQYKPVNLYSHKECCLYFIASTLESIERHGMSEEMLANVI